MTKPDGNSRLLPRVVALLIVLVAGSIVAYTHFSERVESYIAAYINSATVALTVILLLIWFANFSAFNSQTRKHVVWTVVALLVLAAVGIFSLTRREGVINGVGFPRLVWRWAPRPGDDVPQFKIVPTNQPVDLATTKPQDFPEFLGAGGRNAVTGVDLSRDWSKPPRLLWRQPIGLGWSSFAVVGSSAVTLEQRGDQELVVCYDLHTGKPQWAHAHENTRFHDSQGGDGPRSTPSIYEGRVYSMGATGILDCLDGATGNVIWSHNVLNSPDHNQPFGKSCSPLIVGDLVVVTGAPDGPSLIAYRISDGSRAWSGGTESPAYASPVVATLAGTRQIVTVNVGSVTGHDSADGHLLWRFDWPGDMPKTIQPITINSDRLLISAGYGLGTTLLNVTTEGGALSVSPLWTSRHLKPKLSNNIIRGNFLYGLDDPGVLTCLDLSSGKRMWRDGSYGFGQLLLVGDQVLVECESGQVALVQAASDGLHELGRFQALQTQTWSGPALAGHILLVRSDRQAACFELQ